MKTLNELLADPCSFFEAVTGHNPSEFQKLILTLPLKDGMRLAALITRRAGKSTVIAVRILYECLTTNQRRFRVLLLAPSSDQAAIIYDLIREAMMSVPALAQLSEAWAKWKGRKLLFSAEKTEIPQRGGRRVSTVSCKSGDQTKGDATYMVGHGADILVVDESSLVPNGTFKKMKETVRTGEYRSIILIGTPRKETGFFYEACRPKNETEEWPTNSEYESATGWTVLHRNWESIPHLHDNPKIKAEIERDLATEDEQDIQTEYYARFVSGSGKFFSAEDIKACTSRQPVGHWSNWIDNNQIATIDLAIEEDEAVLKYYACTGHHHMTVIYSESYKRKPSKESDTRAIRSKGDIVARMKALRDAGLRPVRVYADCTNDDSFSDLLADAGFKVTPIHWSPKQKTELMFGLKDALSANQIMLPNASEGYQARQLHTQLLNYSYDITEFGNYQWNVRQDTKRRRKKWEDDHVSSLAMATLWLIEANVVKSVTRVGRKSNKWDGLEISSRELIALQ